MSRKLSINRNNPVTPPNTNTTDKIIEGRVFSVILDNTHPKYTGEDSIGVIFYGDVNLDQKDIPDLDGLFQAKPYFSFIKQYPVKYELVKILLGAGSNPYKEIKGDQGFITRYYFPPTNTHNNSNHNALPQKRNSGGLTPTNPQEAGIGMQQNETPSDNEVSLSDTGEFKENSRVKKLQPFEGDIIVEGRHGQGIRMGSTSVNKEKNNWSNNDSEGDPILTISNGLPKTDADATIEDVNNTDSIIIMTSNQNINNINVASQNLQSLGITYENPVGEDIIIADTPTPPFIAPEPVIFTFEEEQDLLATPTILNPSEVIPQEIIGDPIFALLDEAEDAGEIEPLAVEIFEIASSQPDEDDEINNDGSSNTSPGTGTSGATNYNRQSFSDLKTRWRNGETVTVYNRKGTGHTITPPTENFTGIGNNGNRNIKYLWIHTTGQAISATPIDVLQLHFVNNGWKQAGYNWTIPRTGRGAVRLHPDSVITNGVGGKISRNALKFGANKNAINISWIGGAEALEKNNITQQQALTLKRLIFAYLDTYPNIQIGGHNQMGRRPDSESDSFKRGIPNGNSCPNFYVPRYCELLGIEEKNIYRGGYFGQSPNADPNSSIYITNAEAVFNFTDGENIS